MSNLFVDLPVPATPGTAGAAVDVSTMGAVHSFVVEGPERGSVLIEGSQNGTDFSPIRTVNLVRDPAIMSVFGAFAYLRVKRLAGIGAITVAAGGEVVTGNVFLADPIVVPVSRGSDGPIVDISTTPPIKTVTLTGSYQGAIVVLVSNDGSTFNPVAEFNTGGAQTISFRGIYRYIRLRKVGNTAQPIVRFGATSLAGAGGGATLTFDEDFGLTETDFLVRGKADGTTIVFNSSGQYSVVQGSMLDGDYRLEDQGYYWGTDWIPDQQAGISNAIAVSSQQNRIRAHPHLFRQPGVLETLDVQTLNSATSGGPFLFRIGLYDNTPGGFFPRNLLFEQEFDSERTGVSINVFYRIRPNLTVNKNDILWFAYVFDAAFAGSTGRFAMFTGTFNMTGLNPQAGIVVGKNQNPTLTDLGAGNNWGIGFSNAHVYGPMPDPFPTVGAVNMQNSPTTDGQLRLNRPIVLYTFSQDIIP